MGLDTTGGTVDFFPTDTGFLAGVAGATFFATGGAFLVAFPDDWAGLATAFFAGAIFLTLLVDFLAGLAAFFLVAIQLGFF
jgi:hypothetical protein